MSSFHKNADLLWCLPLLLPLYYIPTNHDSLCIIWNSMTCESWVPPYLNFSLVLTWFPFFFRNSLSGGADQTFSFMLPINYLDSNSYACWRLLNLSSKFHVLLGFSFHSFQWKIDSMHCGVCSKETMQRRQQRFEAKTNMVNRVVRTS